MQTGVIVEIIDAGTVVQAFISTGDRMAVVAADGNLWRRAAADFAIQHPESPTLLYVEVEFESTAWGGMEWFTPTFDPSCD